MSTHNIPFLIRKRKNNINYPKSAAMGVVSRGLKNEFETTKVNEPSVLEPLKFYCIYILRVCTKKPTSKQLERIVVYTPITTLSKATSLTSK